MDSLGIQLTMKYSTISPVKIATHSHSVRGAELVAEQCAHRGWRCRPAPPRIAGSTAHASGSISTVTEAGSQQQRLPSPDGNGLCGDQAREHGGQRIAGLHDTDGEILLARRCGLRRQRCHGREHRADAGADDDARTDQHRQVQRRIPTTIMPSDISVSAARIRRLRRRSGQRAAR